MTRAAPFGLNKVVFLSHVVGTNGPVFPREARCRRLAAGSSSGESDPGRLRLPGDGVRADPLA